jgi:hypothetical protein
MLLAAGAIAAGGVAGADAGGPGADAPRSAPRTALVIDASLARDGRELLDPRLEDTEAEVRLPRTAAEARTNVRYFTELGYRVVAAGPDATAAAEAPGASAEIAAGLPAALSAARR